jgi:hypothetical protein
MTDVQTEDELLRSVADTHRVPFDVLVALLGLEADFVNLTSPATKGELSREIARILDEAASRMTM